MSDQYSEAIDNLRAVIQSSRVLLESYKIAYHAHFALIPNRQLTEFLAHTFLRNLILTLCIIFKKTPNTSLQKNLSLEKLLDETFIAKNIAPSELNTLMKESFDIIKNGNLNNLRNQKIAHLDLQVLSDPKIDLTDPSHYEKLVANAEAIFIEILKKNPLKESYEKIDPEADERLIQLRKTLNLNTA